VLRSTAEHPWDWLCDELNGTGVPNLDERIAKLRLRPLHQVLRDVVSGGNCRLLAEVAQESLPVDEAVFKAQDPLLTETPEPATKAPEVEERLSGLLEQAQRYFERITENISAERRAVVKGRTALGAAPESAGGVFADDVKLMLLSAVQVPGMQTTVTADWPAATRALLPDADPLSWAPVLAWTLLRALPWRGERVRVFDELHLREVLAESFGSMGMQGDDVWRAAARVRLLLAYTGAPREVIASPVFWAEGDVRWLAGVNESGGTTYVNQEQFEELWGWMQLPVLVEAAERKASAAEAETEDDIPLAAVCEFAAEAGYELDQLLAVLKPAERKVEEVVVATPAAPVTA
jgi:hypothetical protein